jgi:hypothetical protein
MAMPFCAWDLERFQAKWKPVRVKKTRQIKNLEPRFDSIEAERALENERGQLVERVDGLQAHKHERYDHQIKAKMHEGLATKCFLPRARIAQGREPNSVRIRKGDRPANYSSAIGTESLRRRGSEVMPSSRTSSVGGLLFDASSLLVHAPRKILIPHSTTTMADTSVAAVNTLSKEATLILLSASQPH